MPISPRLARLESRRAADGTPVFIAATARARLLGLAWLDRPSGECALLIPRCRSIHTFGMRFALDVDFLDARDKVLRSARGVPPRRVLWCRGTAAVLERPA